MIKTEEEVNKSPQGASRSATTDIKRKVPLCPHKKTDFRYQLWLQERKSLQERARKSSFRVEARSHTTARDAVTIDTSKTRSNLDVVRLCLQELGYREFVFGKRDGGNCDIHWFGGTFDRNDINGGKINKFPGMVQACRKVNLGRTLDIMQRLFPLEYDYHPRSWFLPQQYSEFVDAVRRASERQHRDVYIVKPDEGSQGEGIYLINDAKEYIFNGKLHVVQQYLAEPLLLEGLKWDLRVYVLLSHLEPLEIYIYEEGLARFCTMPYDSPNNKNMYDTYMHLTNYSLNKNSSTYEHTDNDFDGSKRTMSSVFRKLGSRGYDTEKLWNDIKRIIVKTILAIAPDLKVQYRAEFPPNKAGPSCFQILGFDILVMKDLRPMLLEVNSSPSLSIDYEHEMAPNIKVKIYSALDDEIKRPLVRATLIMMAPKRKIRHISKTRGKSHKGQLADTGVNSDDGTNDSDGYDVTKCVPPIMTSLYPEPFQHVYEDLRILERTVEIFIYCLGVRGSLLMGATSFRNFVRRAQLTSTNLGLSSADFDIMYIDLQRRWEHVNPERTMGLCYQGFLEAFMMLAQRMFPNEGAIYSVTSLLNHCERCMDFTADHKPKPGHLPNISKSDQKLDQLKAMYGGTGRRTIGNSYCTDHQPSQMLALRKTPRRHIIGQQSMHRTNSFE